MAIKGFVMMLGLCAALALAGCGGAPAANQPTGTTAATTQSTAAAAIGVTAAPSAGAVSAASPTSGTTAAAATAKPTTAATKAAAAPSGPPSDIIINAQRAVLNAKAYRARTTSVGAKGATTIRLVEYVQPDRVHIVPSSGVEIIGIKSQGTWTKTTNGVWTKSPSSTLTDTIFSFQDPKVVEEFTKSLIVDQAKPVGPDLIDGKPMLVYQYGTLLKGMGPNGSDISGTYKVWIGVTDGLIYKLDGEQDSAVTAGEKTKSTSIYEYDSSIKIEPPI